MDSLGISQPVGHLDILPDEDEFILLTLLLRTVTDQVSLAGAAPPEPLPVMNGADGSTTQLSRSTAILFPIL